MNVQPTVVLVHGLFGFRKLLWLHYFDGVPALYRSMGMRVLVPRLPWSGNIEARSESLARQLADEHGPLHLVAHSMGGVDARDWIARHDGAQRTASLTTIATPHRGTAAADHVCSTRSPLRLFAGPHSLTRAAMHRFNEQTPDAPHIRYYSYSCARPVVEQPWFLRRYGRVLEREEGANDNQVAVDSARWGEHIATLPCDHYEAIGRDLWLNPFRGRRRFDPMPLYREIGERIYDLAESDSSST